MTNQEINFAAIYIASIAKEDNAVEKVNIAIQSLLSSYDMEAKEEYTYFRAESRVFSRDCSGGILRGVKHGMYK